MKVFKIDSEELLEKIAAYGKKAGRVTTRPLLLLYFVWKSPTTPAKEKRLILLSFAYLLLPIDLIPFSRFALLGLTDEAFSVWTIYKKVSNHITPSIEWEVEKLLEDWFPETIYEILPD
ncbi:MAG: DUF1232 domain-containing protein [Tannerellaceae bacterium]|nr:DUF1232 domain-containing protein [Tannerellaceae bacterium]